MTELRNEALRLAAWHEEQSRSLEWEARRHMNREAYNDWGAWSPSDGRWRKLDTIREYHDATAKTLRALAAQLMATA